MKIRNDFVTNSSSSSFVLGFKSKRSVEKTIEKEKEKMMSDIWLGINDIHKIHTPNRFSGWVEAKINKKTILFRQDKEYRFV